MDVLWWFYTIVLGGAFAQLCVALAVQWKDRVVSGERLHLPTVLWLIFLLVLTIEVWIAVGYYIRSLSSMSVLSMLAFLAVPLGILTLGVFLAEGLRSGIAPATVEAQFDRLRRSFFVVLFLIPIVNLGHELMLGSLGLDVDLLFPALIAVGAVVGLIVRGVRADTWLAGVMLLIVTTYLLTSYGTVTAI